MFQAMVRGDVKETDWLDETGPSDKTRPRYEVRGGEEKQRWGEMLKGFNFGRLVSSGFGELMGRAVGGGRSLKADPKYGEV